MGRTFETDRAAVEGSVVQDAKRQPVAHVVRSPVGVPTDVGRIKSYQVVLEPDVEVTDGASPLVGRQDCVAEVWVAGSSLLCGGTSRGVFDQADRVADGVVEGRSEMVVKESLRGLLDQFRVVEEESLNRIRKPPAS